MIKLPVMAIIIASPIVGAFCLMIWRCTLALHRNQLLRSLVWAVSASLWAIGWSIAADTMLLEGVRWL